MTPLPGADAYPPTIIGADGRALNVIACGRTWCRKCRGPAAAAYAGENGRGWPTCLRCAIRAAKIPCEICGDTTPAMNTFDMGRTKEEGRPALEHESGARCFPLHVDERYRLPCSSCGAELRFRVLAGVARYASGTAQELACVSCGARWALAGVRRVVHVSLVAT